MDRQKLLELTGRLMLATTNQNEEELLNVYRELTEEIKSNDITRENASDEEDCKIGFLKFTNKEISKMNKSFSRTFTQNGRIVHYRRRIRGKHSCSYEIRYRRDGYNISVSAPDLETAKQRFIEAVNRPAGECNVITVPTIFTEFAEYYFEKFYKRRVSTLTFKTETGRYKKHIKPYFGNIKLKSVTPEACQNLIDELRERGLGKTADEVYCILNGIFKTAIKHQIIKFNPLDIIVHITHERETGTAFTKDEEKRLLDSFEGTPYQLMYAVALYTGLRPNEYKTAKIDGRFIVAVNSKQKGGKITYKKIPISPMLAPYLNEVKELNFFVPHILREKLQTVFPWHTLKDLRKTFNTRCEECGVSNIARKLFMGHSLGKLDNTYTGISDDYLLKEGEKLKY